MGLNESCGRLDTQLDALCKKIERTAFDTAGKEMHKLQFKTKTQHGDAQIEYVDYMKSFVWNDLRYSTKKSLTELCAVIQKEMKTRDD